MKIGEIIKSYRMAHDLSMEQFGNMAGISKMTISVFERNFNPKTGKEPSASSDSLKKCARAMGMTLDELIEMLDDDQLINVAVTNKTEFKRSNDIERRFNDFMMELELRKDDMVLDGHTLTKEEKEMLSNMLANDLAMMKRIISHK